MTKKKGILDRRTYLKGEVGNLENIGKKIEFMKKLPIEAPGLGAIIMEIYDFSISIYPRDESKEIFYNLTGDLKKGFKAEYSTEGLSIIRNNPYEEYKFLNRRPLLEN